ncbi:MAG: hypothetical protein GY786_13385 [Proteobacteria bacterium]|nr:hypothetical protein [Pseudomonadota bacterium]
MGYQFLFESVLSSGPITLSIFISLLLLSVYTWGILISKMLQFKQEEQETHLFFLRFEQERDLDVLYKSVTEGDEGKNLIQRGLTSIFYETYHEVLRVTSRIANINFLNPKFDAVKSSVEDGVDRTLAGLEEREYNRVMKMVNVLATTSTIAPFIGLLGTVIGIINAFGEIGKAGSADLAFVAPAISEALVATALGLIVAIPALVGFNYLKNRSLYIKQEYNRFGLQMQNRVQQQYTTYTEN